MAAATRFDPAAGRARRPHFGQCARRRLRAYSLGGGTYTGIEAVSNNVQSLVEPRVRTGKWTMFYMALSLAFTAAGIMVLYLLWDARHVDGRTLNAVTFESIIANIGFGSPAM